MKIIIRNRQHEFPFAREERLIIRQACHAVQAFEGISPNSEVNVEIVDDDYIRFLNMTFRNKDTSTDVLSFPLGENGQFDTNPETGNIMLGDIVISLQTAFRQSFEYNHAIKRECGFLAVHSMLHLLGYDHETSEADKAIMRAKERAILDIMKLTR